MRRVPGVATIQVDRPRRLNETPATNSSVERSDGSLYTGVIGFMRPPRTIAKTPTASTAHQARDQPVSPLSGSRDCQAQRANSATAAGPAEYQPLRMREINEPGAA